MKKLVSNIINRWKAETPIFFKRIIKISLSISSIALAMHLAIIAAGAVEPQWWVDIYPYIIAIPAGMAAAAKLTSDNSTKKIK